MRKKWMAVILIGAAMLLARTARAEEDDKAWREYVEKGSGYAQAAESATNARDRRDNIERAAGQFQAAVRVGKDKKAWRPLVFSAEGYVRLVSAATGSGKDTYTDLANAALESATRIAKEKSEREGLQASIRAYRRLARISAGAKLKAIEAKIESIEKDAEALPETKKSEP